MKRTLLAVCGLSPQVITETLYALFQEGRLPDSVHALTTTEGKARCLSNLFGSGKNMAWLMKLVENGKDKVAPPEPEAKICTSFVR